MLDIVKIRCGFPPSIHEVDEDVQSYIDDAISDMLASGVSASLIASQTASVITAVSLYVKAYIGDDRTDTEKYLDMYRKKVFRLSLAGDEDDDI